MVVTSADQINRQPNKQAKFRFKVSHTIIATATITILYTTSSLAMHTSLGRDLRSVSQDLPTPNRAWLLDNHSQTPVASGRSLVYQVP